MTFSDEAVEAAAHALFEKELGRPVEVADEPLYSEDIQACREDARAALEAAAPHMLAEAQSVAWEHCAKKAEAATKLAAPDHITPMGARVIRKSIEANPYRTTK